MKDVKFMVWQKCLKCGFDNPDKLHRCPNCGDSLEVTAKSCILLTLKILAGILIVYAAIALICILSNLFRPSYYVAKLPGYKSAATIQIDGYMHKSEACCQKVAAQFNADVIKIDPDARAGRTEYGQAVKYKAVFSYCPLCCS